MALAWALRSLRRRRAGEHTLSEAEIADLFGSEWGLDWNERRRLEAMLLAAYQKRGGTV